MYLQPSEKLDWWNWREKHLKAIEFSKANILSVNNTHFSSTKRYYAYGNKGNFGNINNSSVG